MLRNLVIATLCTDYGAEENTILEDLRNKNISYLQEYLNYYEDERNLEKK